ncbi:MAG TPA: FtsX-like permease family protein [Vicinamibacterales bacterium]|nr:FtsX-like permease family protein [Vicinamibacterales bacterium]
MTSVRIAWRNLWRNGRRTTLALLAIGLSVTLVLAYNGMLRGYSDWMLETITGPMLGHVQVHAPKWRETRDMDRTLDDVESLVAALRRDPAVVDVNARIYAPALAALGEEGFAVIVIGVDLAEETRPQRLLTGAAQTLGPGQVLMGDQLARQMGVKAGDVIALVGQAADGSLANDLFTVVAPARTAVDFINRQGVIMSLDQAQTLFAMPGEAHEIMVHARHPEDVPALVDRLRALPAFRGTEILDWKTLAPQMVALIGIVQIAWWLVLVLVFVAAASGVANTMLMATFERTHEFGMLLALGTTPRRLVWMTTLEAVALGLIGAACGTAAGVALVAWTHRTGVDFARLTGGGPSELTSFGMIWSLTFYPTLLPVDVVRVIAAVVITSLLAAAWPAIRVARLQPARALRD